MGGFLLHPLCPLLRAAAALVHQPQCSPGLCSAHSSPENIWCCWFVWFCFVVVSFCLFFLGGLVGFKKKKYFGFLWFCLFCCLFVFMGEFSAGLVRGTGLWKKSQQSAELVRGRSMWLEKRDAGRTWVRSQTLPDRLQHHVGVILWLCSGWARWGEIDVSGSPCASCALWDLTGCTAAQLLQMGMVAMLAPSCPTCSVSLLGGPSSRWVLAASGSCKLMTMSIYEEQRPRGSLLESKQAFHILLSSSAVVFQGCPKKSPSSVWSTGHPF